jgi:hypothetical protein
MGDLYLKTGGLWKHCRASQQGYQGYTGGMGNLKQLYIRVTTLSGPEVNPPQMVQQWRLVREYQPPTIVVPGAVMSAQTFPLFGPQNYRVAWTTRTTNTDPAYNYKVAAIWTVNGVVQGGIDVIPQIQGVTPVRTFNVSDDVSAEVWYINDSGDGPHTFTNTL